MKHLFRLFVVALSISCLLQNPSKLYAVGASGLSTQIVGVKALGQANAFVAQADDPSANYFNPAGQTQLDGWQLTVGGTGVDLETEYEGAGVSETSDNDLSLLPHFYLTGLLPSQSNRKWSIGFGLTTPYGLSTEWSKTGFARYVTTKSTLETLNYNPSVAFAPNEKISFGAGVNYLSINTITQEAQINQSLVGGSDGSQKLEGDGGQWGYNAGVLWKPLERHSFGASYRSQVQVHVEGDVKLTGLDPLVQGAYNFASSEYSTSVETDLTFPQSIILGYYFKPAKGWTWLFDYEWTDWSVFKQTNLTFNESDPTRSSFLNTTNPTPRNWKDVHSFALGNQYQFQNGTKLRLGYSYFTTAVPNGTWDPSIPDANQHTIASGLGHSWGNLTLDLAYNAIIFDGRRVNNDVGSAYGASIDGKYKSWVSVYALGLTYKFLGAK